LEGSIWIIPFAILSRSGVVMKTGKLWTLFGLALSLAVAGCTGEEAAAVQTGGGEAAAVESAPTGQVIEVRMVTEGATNHFVPAEVTAKKGDVIRFVLESGVHNVSFAADPNAAAAGLPSPSAFLQQPGESYDVAVTFPAGKYAFQCDPHAVLGMVGTLTVQ
jgi:plastocyanin